MHRSIIGQAPTFGVVLLHGLYAHENELKPIAEKLYSQFGKSLLLIQPTCRTRFKSVIQSIDQQTENIFQSINDHLLACNKDLASFPLIIIGYSQGGVVACTLGKCFQGRLNIVGIITLSAPLMGTPLLERNRVDLKKFMDSAHQGLTLIDYSLAKIKRSMILQTWMRILTRPKWIGIHGLKDIAPNSQCIKDIYSFLETNQVIPCLLIGTHSGNFLELFNIHLQTGEQHEVIKQLNEAYALFITGNREGKHDSLIPLESQLGKKNYTCKEISIETKMAIPSLSKSPIERRIYSGILHAHNLIALDPGLFVEHGETVLYSDVILSNLMRFISKLV